MEGARKKRLRVSPLALLLGAGTVAWGLWGRGQEASPGMLAALLVAALLHELGHMLAAGLLGVGIKRMSIDLFGARLELPGLLSYRQELAVALGGPAGNLLSILLVWPVWRALGYPCVGLSTAPGELAQFLAGFVPASLGLCAVNLLPVRSLDGGRALSCLLSLCWGETVAWRVLSVSSALVLGGLWLLSVYALLRVGQLLSLFVFSFSLLVRCLRDS